MMDIMSGKGECHHVDTHAKAAFRLELSDLHPIAGIIPHIDSSIEGRRSYILPILGQGYRPDFSNFIFVFDLISCSNLETWRCEGLLRTYNVPSLKPFTRLISPGLKLTAKSSACRYLAIAACYNVMTS